MKKVLIFLFLIGLTGCKEDPKAKNTETVVPKKPMKDKAFDYPEDVAKILIEHGGLAIWKINNTMSFTMLKDDGNEQYTVDLKNRREKIETPNYAMGYDGKDFWLADEKELYEGDPIFYHNLMFYFYAMPFVLADDGINYSATEDLEFDGKSYPGIRVSYDDGVGVSSKDEYFLHYDPETNQMAWLGYTVTFRTGEKSDNIKWIRYDDWQEVNGLILPKTLTWYMVENGKIIAPRSSRTFDNVALSENINPQTFYSVPANGKIVPRQ